MRTTNLLPGLLALSFLLTACKSTKPEEGKPAAATAKPAPVGDLPPTPGADVALLASVKAEPAIANNATLWAIVFSVVPGYQTRVLLNGVQIIETGLEGASGQTNVPGQWLLGGKNDLVILCDKIPAEMSDGPAVTLKLHGLAKPAFPEDADMVAKIEFRPPNAEMAKARYEIELTRGPASELWDAAEPAGPLTGADKAALVGAVNDMADAIVKADVPRLEKHFGYVMKAKGAAESDEELRARVEGLAKAVGPEVAKIPPLKVEEAVFSTALRGKVIRVMRGAGKPALEQRTDEGSFALDTYFARMKGGWMLVR